LVFKTEENEEICSVNLNILKYKHYGINDCSYPPSLISLEQVKQCNDSSFMFFTFWIFYIWV